MMVINALNSNFTVVTMGNISKDRNYYRVTGTMDIILPKLTHVEGSCFNGELYTNEFNTILRLKPGYVWYKYDKADSDISICITCIADAFYDIAKENRDNETLKPLKYILKSILRSNGFGRIEAWLISRKIMQFYSKKYKIPK